MERCPEPTGDPMEAADRRTPGSLVAVLVAAVAFPAAAAPAGSTIDVDDDASLRAALGRMRPGVTVLIAPGDYAGGLRLEGVAGEPGRPVVIRGADPERPPRFTGGGSTAFHLVDARHVTLAHLRVTGFPGNGVNADDGGTFDTPAEGLVFDSLVIEDTGPRGNHDALKLSGVRDFVVRNCSFAGWGGSAIDMVGCRDGVVEDCHFEGKDGFTTSNAVQMKGGTRGIAVLASWFRDCGHRSINLGGSTGLAYFRPAPGDCEATDIEIAGNRFTGSDAPIAWVTARGGRVHHNTFHRPGRWVLRILQEAKDERFVPCRDGVFEKNLVVFDGRLRSFVNVGGGTAPETFRFRGNAWFDLDGDRRPDLPTKEEDGVHGVDPRLEDPGGPEMRATSKDPRLGGIGADGWLREK